MDYKIHKLKLKDEYFEPVLTETKRFELRKDDRDYKVGDWLMFLEVDSNGYTGRETGCFRIEYILRDCSKYGLMDGYCILGFS